MIVSTINDSNYHYNIYIYIHNYVYIYIYYIIFLKYIYISIHIYIIIVIVNDTCFHGFPLNLRTISQDARSLRWAARREHLRGGGSRR